jgi:TRAP transporter TAXI family solute receptor
MSARLGALGKTTILRPYYNPQTDKESMMKKTFFCLVALLLIISMGSKGVNLARAEQKLDVTIIGGSIAGAWYAIAQGMAESIKRTYPGSRADVVPGGDAANVKRIGNNDGTVAFCYLPTAISGFEGVPPFAAPMSDLRVVATVFPAYEQFYILAKSGITSFEQIREKNYPLKLGANIKHSASEVLIKSALEFYGMTYQDIENWGGKIMFLQTNPTNDLIKGGSLEAHVGTFPVPYPTLAQLNATHKIRLLSMSDGAIEFLKKRHGGDKGVIKAGTYPFQKEDVQTLRTFCLLIANRNLPDATAYAITKAIDKNREYLGVVHKAMANYSAEFMATPHKIPFHDGTLKYYREIGVIK